MFSRQAQNLRDELYQAKLRLEKETSSLREANKVSCSCIIFFNVLLDIEQLFTEVEVNSCHLSGNALGIYRHRHPHEKRTTTLSVLLSLWIRYLIRDARHALSRSFRYQFNPLSG